MKSTRCILSIILGLLAGWLPLGAVTVLKNLQVEYQTNPLGIDVSQPRFNWQMESDRYGACGQAYRLWVADSPEQLAAGRYIYDSGKVLSGNRRRSLSRKSLQTFHSLLLESFRMG